MSDTVDLRARRAAIDAAEWDVHVGTFAGGAVVFLRAMAITLLLVGDGPIDPALMAQFVVQLVLAVAFTWGVHRRHTWAAVALMVAWGAPWAYSWWLSGRALPPLGLIGIAIWYGLFRGLRGTRRLAAQRARDAAAP